MINGNKGTNFHVNLFLVLATETQLNALFSQMGQYSFKQLGLDFSEQPLFNVLFL